MHNIYYSKLLENIHCTYSYMYMSCASYTHTRNTCMVLAGDVEWKLQAIISDNPQYLYGASEIVACNFHSTLLISTIHYISMHTINKRGNVTAICAVTPNLVMQKGSYNYRCEIYFSVARFNHYSYIVSYKFKLTENIKCIVLASNFMWNLKAIILDILYEYYGLSEIMTCNFCSKSSSKLPYMLHLYKLFNTQP